MGLITRALTPAVRTIVAYRTSPKQNPADVAAAVGMTHQRRVGKTNVDMYRDWSIHGEFVRMAIDIRKGQLERAEWELIPWDRDGPTPDKGLMRRITEQLTQPNPGDASFGTFLSAVGEDILVLDAGCVEKERMLNGEIAALWPTDGGPIKVDRFWDGDPRMPRYYWEPNTMVSVPLLNSDLIYMKLHTRSYSPVGISYLETLKMAIDAELQGSLFNASQTIKATPDGVMDLGENARPDQVTSFQSFFQNELEGRSVMAFWGGTKGAKFIPFRGQGMANRDIQFLEWLRYEVTKIAGVFQLSVQDFGLLHDINRSTGEVQQENTEDRGYKTLLGNVGDFITSEICWDRGFGGRKNNIRFVFRDVSDRASKAKADVHKLAAAGMPWESINEARKDVGLPPIGDPADDSNPFNWLMANTPLGFVILNDQMGSIPTPREMADMNKPVPSEPNASPQVTKALEALTSQREPANDALDIMSKAIWTFTQREPVVPNIEIHPAPVEVNVEVPEKPRKRSVTKTITYNADGRPQTIVETPERGKGTTKTVSYDDDGRPQNIVEE